ncbi:hypothetical protein BJX66DRAFT_312959 [Aspergillus keveii]|uniref:Uncharacterized protein n=1 Tax=Aspergillus keveii TaxID=714993 RepID=A0ABR4FSW9_9EURO
MEMDSGSQQCNIYRDFLLLQHSSCPARGPGPSLRPALGLRCSLPIPFPHGAPPCHPGFPSSHRLLPLWISRRVLAHISSRARLQQVDDELEYEIRLPKYASLLVMSMTVVMAPESYNIGRPSQCILVGFRFNSAVKSEMCILQLISTTGSDYLARTRSYCNFLHT